MQRLRDPSNQNIREKKGLDSGSIVEEDRDKSAKLSLVLIGSLLVCCALPAILVSAGAGIAAYSFLKGWNVILILASILLLIFGAFALNCYYRKRNNKKTDHY